MLNIQQLIYVLKLMIYYHIRNIRLRRIEQCLKPLYILLGKRETLFRLYRVAAQRPVDKKKMCFLVDRGYTKQAK